MIDTHCRTLYQNLFLCRVVNMLAKRKISPETVTLAGLIAGLAVIPALALCWPVVAFFCLLLSGFLDTVDGALARHCQKSSPNGAVLDIVSDRTVEFSAILGLFLYAPDERGLLCILMLGAILVCVTSFLVVSMFLENASEKSFQYSPGLVERAEAFAFFSLMILFPSLFYLLGLIFTILVFATAIIRVMEFRFSESGVREK